MAKQFENDIKRLHIVCKKLDASVPCLLGPTNPVPSGGYGGWEVQSRPHRIGVTNWTGRNPFELRIDIMINEFESDGSVEDRIVQIERMTDADDSLNPRRPPLIQLRGISIPQKYRNMSWVIQDIAWGKTIRSLATGQRIQQAATISFMEHVDSKVVEENSSLPGHGVKPKYRIYIVKRGETLKSIARKLYDDVSKWKVIARLNNIHDQTNIAAGQKLRVPRK